MDASVSLKIAPAEFDTIRRSLTASKARLLDLGDNSSLNSQERREAKAEALKVGLILEKLQ